MSDPFVSFKTVSDDSLIEWKWLPVDAVPDSIWIENPKEHDIGKLIELIQNVGFDDFPRWNKNLLIAARCF